MEDIIRYYKQGEKMRVKDYFQRKRKLDGRFMLLNKPAGKDECPSIAI